MTGRFIEMGQIVAPHGIRGEVKINPNCEAVGFAAYAPFYDEAGQALKLTVKRVCKNQVIAVLDTARDRNAAELLRGKKLFIPRDALPALNANEYYVADLIGMDVIENDTLIGQVQDVQNYGASDILQIKTKGQTILVAMSPDTILNVDMDKRQITVALPTEVEADDES